MFIVRLGKTTNEYPYRDKSYHNSLFHDITGIERFFQLFKNNLIYILYYKCFVDFKLKVCTKPLKRSNVLSFYVSLDFLFFMLCSLKWLVPVNLVDSFYYCLLLLLFFKCNALGSLLSNLSIMIHQSWMSSSILLFFYFLFVSKPANTSVGKIVYCISLFCCMLLHFQHSRCSIMSNYFNTVAVYIYMCNNLFINIIRYGTRRGATEVWRIIYPHFYCIKILIPFCCCCFWRTIKKHILTLCSSVSAVTPGIYTF